MDTDAITTVKPDPLMISRTTGNISKEFLVILKRILQNY